ncbi:hypothetical protein Ddye_000545 [Dipteronia dyeriana]|uniref:Uncharacterized protein n=1 Tax=Dipteronia dyeriana TaxID=168575 RepID=A0AAD9XMF1_9ROSI|nr:hypothetical protein Ddye_000545 [Dipteronia dyeriana]
MGFDEEFMAVFLLIQLPESWKRKSQSIANSLGKENLNLQQVVNMIMTEEIRMREEGLWASISLVLNLEEVKDRGSGEEHK